MNTNSKAVACVLLGLVIFGGLPRASGDSGGPVVYTFGHQLDNNESMYALYYNVPSVIQTGVKENLTFYVYITELSGWKVVNERRILTVNINTPSATVATLRVNDSSFLYQGARWGPFNMTLDLTASQAGLSPGQMTNATVYANLIVYEHYDDPRFPFLVDAGETLQVTHAQIVSPAGNSGLSSLGGSHLFASIAVGAAVVAALAGVALMTRKRASGNVRPGP